jgi:hypothetical protein
LTLYTLFPVLELGLVGSGLAGNEADTRYCGNCDLELRLRYQNSVFFLVQEV